mmetsp:Transcript_12260/g.17627  ORF Transcript_12260/g.17627 Transcript_12260/m.17627 type:complete len:150 (-) Transcript_12260:414-863(-)
MVKRGKVFDDYLGMKMDFSEPGKVISSMVKYVERLIVKTPEELLKRPCATPAANHLFQVNDNTKPLSKLTADLYHYLTAMILYLPKKTRPDIQTTVSFLSTRVQKPSVNDLDNAFDICLSPKIFLSLLKHLEMVSFSGGLTRRMMCTLI